eukprot:NODE_4053_length_715_cov_283.630303.p2 GENE.NODE_4053_length_715_cov_283.630303~~NODE_4053_length_715_cov_283.630303.p2  ORF type:complete len:134 (-),score=38.56 NODE_4053_length_715_cov_283.630303:91-492(-)
MVNCGVAAPRACTGTGGPQHVPPFSYGGGSLGETVKVTVTSMDSKGGQGTFDVTGSGLETITCKHKAFTKRGQSLITDLSDCVTGDITVNSIEYCSDQDIVQLDAKVGMGLVHVPLSLIQDGAAKEIFEPVFT